MYKRIKNIILQNNLVKKGQTVACAVSGGADSMALLHILKKLSKVLHFTLYCLHMEHGIRGEESKKDAEFVRSQCELIGVPCFVMHADVLTRAKEKKYTVEAAAREERYAFFDSMSKSLNIDKIALAHHMDDQAETALINLLRGAGIKGFTAMEMVREPNIIRPLLNVRKDEILDYVRDEKIPFVVDSTNEDTRYIRNRIRKILVPAIKMINPGFTSVLMRLLDILREDEAALNQLSKEAYNTCVEADGKSVRIKCETLEKQPKAVKRRIIRIALNESFGLKDIEYKHIEDILKLSERQKTGKSIDIKNHLVARMEYGVIIIERQKGAVFKKGMVPFDKDKGAVFIQGGVKLECFVTEVYNVDMKRKAPNEEYFDYDKFPGNAVVRFRYEGDVIHPLNFLGKKKLKNYLSDKKIPLNKRDLLPLIADGRNVLWVTGYGISDDVKIDENTVYALKIAYKNL